MKKLFVSILAIGGFFLPVFSQVDHDFSESDKIPVESLVLKKDQIPSAIVKAVSTDFINGQPVTWGKFPYVLKDYGWIINPDANVTTPDQYEVLIKAKNGSDIYAVYKPDGTILESRSLYKNVPLPSTVKDRLAKSQYKDWGVVGDKEIIMYYNGKKDVREHFRLTVEKNNVKHAISFNYDESVTN